MQAEDLTHLIERFEDTEKRLGVRLAACSATINVLGELGSLHVCGEIHSVREDGKIPRRITIKAAVYNSQGQVAGVGETDTWEKEGFFGFDVFELEMNSPSQGITKIRLFVRPGIDWD